MATTPDEEPLTGGNVSASVARVGDTVRRPGGFWSPSVDALLRHLNAVGYEGAPRSLGFDDLVHHDLAPWNLVCGSNRWVFIDWDNAGPGSRLWDLAYAAQGFVPLEAATPPATAAGRLRAFAEGYRLEEHGRRELAELLHRRIMSMYELLHDGRYGSGIQPWHRLWSEGHGDTWLGNAEYVQRHYDLLRDALVHTE